MVSICDLEEFWFLILYLSLKCEGLEINVEVLQGVVNKNYIISVRFFKMKVSRMFYTYKIY